MKVLNNITEAIGNTPLVQLKGVESKHSLNAHLYAKVEGFNPAGSVKDRIAYSMIVDAVKSGKLKVGSTIIEPTSGNTGIGIAMVGVSLGFRVILVMPETMSAERRSLMKIYGAELVLTEGSKGMSGAIAKANELQKEIPNSIILGQFVNKANPKAHFEHTGPEIYSALDGNVDVFVAGIGTGGTITGVGHYLKQKNPNIKVIAVEPEGSPVLSKGTKGSHKIQGIGAGFVPEILDTTVYDEIITVSDENAINTAREVCGTEGIFVGISSGASLYAALEIAKRSEYSGKNIVALFPDNGDRYFSIFA